MLIKFDGEEYNFNLNDIDVNQAEQVYDKVGLTLMGLEEGLSIGHPGAMKAVFWLMLAQNGKAVAFEQVNFKIIPFANATQAAKKAEDEEEARVAKLKKASPKGGPGAKVTRQTSTPSDLWMGWLAIFGWNTYRTSPTSCTSTALSLTVSGAPISFGISNGSTCTGKLKKRRPTRGRGMSARGVPLFLC